LGDLSSVLHASAARLARHGVVAFSTEAPPRSGGANEHEGQLAEASAISDLPNTPTPKYLTSTL